MTSYQLLLLVPLIVFFATKTTIINADEVFNCAHEIDKFSLTYVLDSTESMGEYLDMFQGTDGIMKTLMEDTIMDLGDKNVYGNVFSFQDKHYEPYGETDDFCWHPLKMILATLPESVGNLTYYPLGGGDDKDAQIDGIYLSGMTMSLITRAAGAADMFTFEGYDGPVIAKDIADVMNVVIMVTDSAPHTSEDGPPGYPLPPNDAAYDCNNTAYPSFDQLNHLYDEENLRLIVVTDLESVPAYQSYLAGATFPYRIVTIGSKEQTLIDLKIALNELYCIIECDPSHFNLQFMLTQDTSYSYKNDLVTINQKFPSLTSTLVASYQQVEFGLSSFADKPIRPMGQPEVDGCYDLKLNFTLSEPEFLASLYYLDTTSGKDWKESQLDAMYHSTKDVPWSKGDFDPSGRYGQLRVMCINTDSGYHTLGQVGGGFDPSKKCSETDYPAIEDVANALSETDIFPLFIVTDDILPIYQNLLESLGLGRGVVKSIGADYEEIAEAIEAGIYDVCTQRSKELIAKGAMRR